MNRRYHYSQAKSTIVFCLVTSVLSLILLFANDALNFALVAVLSFFILSSLYGLRYYQKQYIELSDEGIVVPSYVVNSLFIRRIPWSNIKSVKLRSSTHSGVPTVNIKLIKGFQCKIIANAVEIKGARSRGLEPYQQLIEDIEGAMAKHRLT
ncbi:MAG: hypothetical protein ABNH02_04130 [Pseudomonadales bacterium]|jgi:hypothetical protein